VKDTARLLPTRNLAEKLPSAPPVSTHHRSCGLATIDCASRTSEVNQIAATWPDATQSVRPTKSATIAATNATAMDQTAAARWGARGGSTNAPLLGAAAPDTCLIAVFRIFSCSFEAHTSRSSSHSRTMPRVAFTCQKVQRRPAVDAQSKDVAIPRTFRLARALHLKRCVTARPFRSVDAGGFVYRPGLGYKGVTDF
jgi:hypothetical protein